MSDRLSYASALANAEPRAREPRDCTPDFTGRSATLVLEDIEVPFGVLHGEVEIEGDADGRWSVVEVILPNGSFSELYIEPNSKYALHYAIFRAFAVAVTDDMAYDALKQD